MSLLTRVSATKFSMLALALLGMVVADLLGIEALLCKGGEGGAVNLPCATQRSAQARNAMLAAGQTSEDYDLVWNVDAGGHGLSLMLPTNLHSAEALFHGVGISFSAGHVTDMLHIPEVDLEAYRRNQVDRVGIMLVSAEGYCLDILIDLTPQNDQNGQSVFRVFVR